jgi:hypothetical protein
VYNGHAHKEVGELVWRGGGENYGGKRSFVGTIIQGRIVPRVIAVVRFGSTIPQPENALNGGVEA